MVLHFFCLVPLAYVLGIVLNLGLVGIWGSAAVYILLLATAMSYKFREGKWKLIKI
jgi:Na+-driven multidrug efflux pump